MKPANPARDGGDRRWRRSLGHSGAEPDLRVLARHALAEPRAPATNRKLDASRWLEAVDVGAVEQTDFDQAHGGRSIWAVDYPAAMSLEPTIARVTDHELELLRTHLEASLPDYLADLERLVNIDCGSYVKEGVDEVGRWMADQLAELGAAITVDANSELGDIVVGELDGAGGPRAVLIGHMDTVFPDGTAAARPFAMSEGRAYGPGVDDMKGGLLGGLYALRALRSLHPPGTPAGEWLPFSRLTYVANPDEELGSPTSSAVIRRVAQGADLALVLESARENGDIVSSRKGIAEFHVRIDGRAAHAGVEPEKGRSATVEAAHKVLAITALNGRWEGVTVNVGVVRGGTRPNVVAETCELEIDVRAVINDNLTEVEAAINEICATTEIPDITITIERLHYWPPMEKNEATAELAGQAIELAARLGFELRDAATGGASDANTTSGLGVPTLDGLGPVGGGDHAPSEYLEIDSVVPRTTIIAALLLGAGR